MSDFKPVNQPITPASAEPGEEFPFLHTITVVDRVVSVDNPELVQNNIRTETVTLNLDSEWDGLSCIINIGSGKTPTSLIWSGQPVIIPAELMTDIGTLNVSVVGYGDNGTVRAVTKKADAMFVVAASGYVHDDNPVPDPTTILGQLIQAADNANQAADRFNQASEDIGDISDAAIDAKWYADAAKTSETNAAASATAAQQAVDGLQTTVKEQGSKINQNTNTISQVSQKADSLKQDINSFKTTVSETYTTKDEFDDLSISGANLVKNSRELSTTYSMARWSIDSSGEFSYAHSTDSTVGTWSEVWIPLYAEYNSITGQCMVSFEGKNLNSLFCVSLAAFNSSNGRVEEIGNLMLNNSRFSSSVLDDGWTRYVAYFTASEVSSINKLSSATQYVIEFKRSPSTSTTNFQFRKPKVELGTKPTAWSPAPEDFDGKYTSKTEFKQILSNYVPLSTYQALEARVQALEAKLANK